MGSAASGPGETILQLTTLALPAVAVTSPAPGALAAGATTISASATVSAGTSLQRLDVEVDGAIIASGAASPLAASWDAEPGDHVIVARALDAAGNAASSDEVRVTVGSSAQGGGGGTDGGTPPSTPAGSPMQNLHSSGCNSTGVDFTGAPVFALALVLRRRRLRRCGS